MSDDPLDDLNAASEDLLRLYEMADVVAITLTLVGNQVIVRCQDQSHVLWMCKKVVEQYDTPSGRTVN